jgi:hypothetical protein
LASCFCEIYSEPCLAWAVHTTNDNAYGLLAFSIVSGTWFRVVLGSTTFVADGTINDIQIAWGTDGTNIFTMFSDLVDPVTSTFAFKYWNFGSAIGYKRVLKMGIVTLLSAPTSATLNLFNESGTAQAAPFGSQTQNFTSFLIFIGKDGNPINWTN